MLKLKKINDWIECSLFIRDETLFQCLNFLHRMHVDQSYRCYVNFTKISSEIGDRFEYIILWINEVPIHTSIMHRLKCLLTGKLYFQRFTLIFLCLFNIWKHVYWRLLFFSIFSGILRGSIFSFITSLTSN